MLYRMVSYRIKFLLNSYGEYLCIFIRRIIPEDTNIEQVVLFPFRVECRSISFRRLDSC